MSQILYVRDEARIPHTLLQPTGLPFCERFGPGPADFSVRAHRLARA
jgi:hypothetical protein